jgi:hypothetical protein
MTMNEQQRNEQQRNQQAQPQSQSQPGGTNENMNEDKANGTQSQVQPGGQGDTTATTGGETSGDAATPNAGRAGNQQ